MELRNLRTLVRIAELGSFSAAAEDLGYTQSTVTMEIKALVRSWAHRSLTASGGGYGSPTADGRRYSRPG